MKYKSEDLVVSADDVGKMINVRDDSAAVWVKEVLMGFDLESNEPYICEYHRWKYARRIPEEKGLPQSFEVDDRHVGKIVFFRDDPRNDWSIGVLRGVKKCRDPEFGYYVSSEGLMWDQARLPQPGEIESMLPQESIAAIPKPK